MINGAVIKRFIACLYDHHTPWARGAYHIPPEGSSGSGIKLFIGPP